MIALPRPHRRVGYSLLLLLELQELGQREAAGKALQRSDLAEDSSCLQLPNEAESACVSVCRFISPSVFPASLSL